MVEKEEQKRRKQFKDIIKDMSVSQDVFKNPNKLDKVYKQLLGVYKGETGKVEFRHYYSDIFSVLSILKNDGIELDIVSQNLKMVYDYCTKKGDTDLCNSVRKFLDHTNLEISRINYVNAIENRMDITGENFGNAVNNINKQVAEATKNVSNVKKKMDNSYSDFISILGIFAGIVLVFFGGTSVFGNIISSMQKTDVWKSVLICTLTGVVVFNTIFMFIYFISKLLDRSISATNERGYYWQPIFFRFKKRYPLVFWVNIVLSSLMILSGVYGLICQVGKISINGIEVSDLVLNYIVDKFNNHKYVMLFVIGVFILDIVFMFAYLIAKLNDVNIGTRISLCHGKWIDWEYENDKYVVKSTTKIIKSFDTADKAQKYAQRIRYRNELNAHLSNFFKRCFFRYPYISIINIVMILVVVFNIN